MSVKVQKITSCMKFVRATQKIINKSHEYCIKKVITLTSLKN